MDAHMELYYALYNGLHPNVVSIPLQNNVGQKENFRSGLQFRILSRPLICHSAKYRNISPLPLQICRCCLVFDSDNAWLDSTPDHGLSIFFKILLWCYLTWSIYLELSKFNSITPPWKANRFRCAPCVDGHTQTACSTNIPLDLLLRNVSNGLQNL